MEIVVGFAAAAWGGAVEAAGLGRCGEVVIEQLTPQREHHRDGGFLLAGAVHDKADEAGRRELGVVDGTSVGEEGILLMKFQIAYSSLFIIIAVVQKFNADPVYKFLGAQPCEGRFVTNY